MYVFKYVYKYPIANRAGNQIDRVLTACAHAMGQARVHGPPCMLGPWGREEPQRDLGAGLRGQPIGNQINGPPILS